MTLSCLATYVLETEMRLQRNQYIIPIAICGAVLALAGARPTSDVSSAGLYRDSVAACILVFPLTAST
jgi:hypothetical protein